MGISSTQRIALSGLCIALFITGCGGGGGGSEQDSASEAASAPVDGSSNPGLPESGKGGSAPPPSTSPDPSPNPAPAPTPVPAPAPEPTAAALPAGTTCGLANFRDEIMKLINQARATGRYCGSTYYDAASPMRWNDKLFNAAAAHSTDMANKNYFSHTGQDGSTFSQRISAAGYAWRTAGENIAAGQNGIQQVMDGWMDSPGHCANIMNNAYTEVGVSCVYQASSTYKRYWTMELAAPR